MCEEMPPNFGAISAGQMAAAAIAIDTSLSCWAGDREQIRIRVQGTEHTGKFSGFDGERMLLVDDLGVPILIYLKSGVVIIGPKDEE